MADVELSFDAKLSASLDGINAQLARANARAQQALNHTPAPAPVHGQGATGGTGTVVFPCGGPAQGRIWQVRSLAIGGTGLVAGIARFYAAGAAPSASGLQMIGVRDTITFKTSSLRTTFYGTGSFLLYAPQTLWVVVVTATHTKTVSVEGIAEDYDFAAYHAVLAL